jgi:hypothetical protein
MISLLVIDGCCVTRLQGIDEVDSLRVRSHTNGAPIGVPLGRFTYVANSTQLQTFDLTHPAGIAAQAYSIVTVAFLSNYGHPTYTCIYRVRVHGEHAN